jgi:hypothetical protein
VESHSLYNSKLPSNTINGEVKSKRLDAIIMISLHKLNWVICSLLFYYVYGLSAFSFPWFSPLKIPKIIRNFSSILPWKPVESHSHYDSKFLGKIIQGEVKSQRPYATIKIFIAQHL